MKIRLVTLGCKLNFAESSALINTLIAKGHTRAKAGEDADIIIVNTCTVTDTADHKDRQAIHRLRRENPNAKIILTGCYAELLRRKQNNQPVSSSLHNSPSPLNNSLSEADQRVIAEIDHLVPKQLNKFLPAYSKDDRTRCFLKVQDGCNYFCTYCTIPLARGRSRNPEISFITTQAQQAILSGAKEIILTGVNIGDFGRTTGETFLQLLQQLDLLHGDYRLRISSCEPNLLTDEIIDFVAQSTHFAPHFHIPLQSGSNEVLQLMHRRYTRELFQERVQHIRHLMPHAFIGVDCMVGVRGETEEYFEDYLHFVTALPVSQLHVFTYSERAHTRMLDMDLYIVPNDERERRSKILHQISQDKLSQFYAQQKGLPATVLWEGKKDKNGCMAGFTENYVKVFRPYDSKRINTFETIIV